jgi:hypothetical protein
MFKTLFLVGILRFKSGFMWIFWALNQSFVTDIWAIFWLREILGYFLKNWAFFLQNFWSPCIQCPQTDYV